MENEFFNSSDGWLLATLSSGRKSSLVEIIRTGDTLNHSIFSLDEINDGLSRLESEGFIIFEKSTVKRTNKAKRFDKKGFKGLFEGTTEILLRYWKLFDKMPLSAQVSYKKYFSIAEYEAVCKDLGVVRN